MVTLHFHQWPAGAAAAADVFQRGASSRISGRCQLLVSHTDGSDLTLVLSVRAHMYFLCARV